MKTKLMAAVALTLLAAACTNPPQRTSGSMGGGALGSGQTMGAGSSTPNAGAMGNNNQNTSSGASSGNAGGASSGSGSGAGR